jgi:hypothetical protein
LGRSGKRICHYSSPAKSITSEIHHQRNSSPTKQEETMTLPNGTEPSSDDQDLGFHQTITEELYTELVEQVEGEKVVGLALWDESLADEEDVPVKPEEREVFDFDLYVENNLYLELYATYIFEDPEGDPLRGLDQIGKIFSSLIEEGVWLEEVATTTENELVLILSRNYQPKLYLNVGGWAIEEWETLPEED